MEIVKLYAGWIFRQLWTKLGIGLVTVVPFAGTLWIIYWVFTRIDNILQPFLIALMGRHIPGLGFSITITLIFITGLIASNVVGKKIIHRVESVIPWIPVIRWLYTGIKQILESFTATRKTNQWKPVLTEFPRKGMHVIGFVTNEIPQVNGDSLMSVFIPTSPNPTSGFLQIVEEKELTPVNLTVDSALKMIISAGKVTPIDFCTNLPKN